MHPTRGDGHRVELGFETVEEGKAHRGNDGGKAKMRQVWGYQRRDGVSRMHRPGHQRCQAWQSYAVWFERGIVSSSVDSLSDNNKDGSVSGARH